jgi:hypothetical protein
MRLSVDVERCGVVDPSNSGYVEAADKRPMHLSGPSNPHRVWGLGPLSISDMLIGWEMLTQLRGSMRNITRIILTGVMLADGCLGLWSREWMDSFWTSSDRPKASL